MAFTSANIYGTKRWRAARRAALDRDDARCTVSRLLGGACAGGPLHVHHIEPINEGGAPFALENLGTSCARHHPQWEALRRELVRRREPKPPPRCRHKHRYLDARLICEARLARRARERELEAA